MRSPAVLFYQKSCDSTKSGHWELCFLFLFKIKIMLNQSSRLQQVRKQTNKPPSKQASRQTNKTLSKQASKQTKPPKDKLGLFI